MTEAQSFKEMPRILQLVSEPNSVTPGSRRNGITFLLTDQESVYTVFKELHVCLLSLLVSLRENDTTYSIIGTVFKINREDITSLTSVCVVRTLTGDLP